MNTKSVLTTLFLTVSMAFGALAQDFQITKSSLAGGSSSSGGGFSLTGTTEQTPASNLNGADYSLQSGFLAGIVVQQTPGAPTISVSRNGTDIILTWTTTDADWTLEFSSIVAASAATWTPATEPVVQANNQRTATLKAPTGIRFYRLRKSNPK